MQRTAFCTLSIGGRSGGRLAGPRQQGAHDLNAQSLVALGEVEHLEDVLRRQPGLRGLIRTSRYGG